jgi:hypothetical protein
MSLPGGGGVADRARFFADLARQAVRGGGWWFPPQSCTWVVLALVVLNRFRSRRAGEQASGQHRDRSRR